LRGGAKTASRVPVSDHKIVDFTGAGDLFRRGFLSARCAAPVELPTVRALGVNDPAHRRAT